MRDLERAAMLACAAVLSCSANGQLLERDAVLMYYHTLFRPADNVLSGWNGDVATCNAGMTASAFKNAVVARVNFYRRLAGLSAVTLASDNRATDAQNAALLVSANGIATNNPPPSATCYSASAYNGSFNSLLALGVSGVNAVDLYMDDASPAGYSAATRRWLLYGAQQTIATGDITSGVQANALWALGPFHPNPVVTGVPWPPQGYVPWDVMPAASNRWSWSAAGGQFGDVGQPPTANARVVEKTGPGNATATAPPAPKELLASGYGDETFVFRPQAADYSRPLADRRYDVNISFVTTSSAFYSVVAIDSDQLSVGLTADFNGDGKSDLVWHNPSTGQTSLWLVDGAGFAPGSGTIRSDPAWRPTVTGDFNGDGRADIVWRNDATRETQMWLMNGAQTISSHALQAFGWRVIATGDFNGDGKSDLVWSQTSANGFGTGGTLGVWFMNGGTALGFLSPGSTTEPPHIVDLNGDGYDELIRRVDNVTYVHGTQLSADWNTRVTHTGDFNGDGKTDLVWRNEATGETSIALMNGTATIANPVILANANWKVVGVGDFNGDGKSDLLWRNRATGEVAIWQMDGTYFAGGAIILGLPEWQVVKIGNFNGDVGPAGKPKDDLLWRNTQTGAHAIWLMNSYTFAGGAIVLGNPTWWATP